MSRLPPTRNKIAKRWFTFSRSSDPAATQLIQITDCVVEFATLFAQFVFAVCMSLSIFILLILTLAVLSQFERLSESCRCGIQAVGLICVPVLQVDFRQWRGPQRTLENIPPPGIDRQLMKTPASGTQHLTTRGACARPQNLSS